MLEIIYEDEGLIVCYKPAGTPVESRSMAISDMSSLLRNYRLKKGEEPDIYVVHRLDQPVEGLMVFAKEAKSAANLSQQVASGGFHKIYHCVVTDLNLPDDEELVDYLLKDGKTNLSKVVNKDDKRSKRARLKYNVIKRDDDKCLLRVELFTGRHHQIRCQLSNRGAAIIGDVKYGGRATGRPLALCSTGISFVNPSSNEKMEFACEPKGVDFAGLM